MFYAKFENNILIAYGDNALLKREAYIPVPTELESELPYLKIVDGKIVADKETKVRIIAEREKSDEIAEIEQQMAVLERQFIQKQILGEYAPAMANAENLEKKYLRLYQRLVELQE